MTESKALNTHGALKGRRPTWAEIDLQALAENFSSVKEQVGPGVTLMAVVKANAYGHGAVECARRLEAEGADWFGVALPEEGIELRHAGIEKPILCLAGFWEGQADACLQNKLTPAVYQLETIEALDRAARDRGEVADVHVKLDTGMGRLGVRFDEVGTFVGELQRFRNVRIDGLMSHFAAADEPRCGSLTSHQIERFENATNAFREHGFQPTYTHIANSAGVFGQSGAFAKGTANMVRPGGVLYGLWRDILDPAHRDGPLKAVMSLHSQITLLKWVPAGETVGYGCTFEASSKTRVATVPIGYDDGYMRALSNRGHAIIRGVYATVIGRISMDLTIIDVTNVPDVAVNDQVTLMGRVDHLAVTAEDIAKTAGTLSYEVTCGIGTRVPRVYL